MNRKLSEQQREIMRAAYLVNAVTQAGNHRCKVEPETVETSTWYCNLYRDGKDETTASYSGPPDMANNYAAWLVLGLPYRGHKSRFVEQRPLDITASQSASVKRTIRRLKDRGLLIGRRYKSQHGTFASGHLLTAEGFGIAASLPPLIVSNIGWFLEHIINRDNYVPGGHRAGYGWESANVGAEVIAKVGGES